jgi:hypothetical protein
MRKPVRPVDVKRKPKLRLIMASEHLRRVSNWMRGGVGGLVWGGCESCRVKPLHCKSPLTVLQIKRESRTHQRQEDAKDTNVCGQKHARDAPIGDIIRIDAGKAQEDRIDEVKHAQEKGYKPQREALNPASVTKIRGGKWEL